MKPKTVGRIRGGNPTQVPSESTGFLAQSIILTLDGEKPVGDIKPGDRVITRDSGMALVKAVQAQHRDIRSPYRGRISWRYPP